MIAFSSFNNVELFHSMFADCCMLKSWEGGPMAAIGWRRPPSSIDINHACCRNRLLSLFFHLFRRHHHHASFPHDVPSRTTQHNDRFSKEAAKPAALMPERMLIVTLSGKHRQLRGMLPYIFLRMTQLTTTPQRPSTRRDLIGRQRPPWCPTPNADAHNGHPVCWLIVVCSGTGSGAPWRPWGDSDRQGRRGML
jgi:hypothetical protein